MKKTHNLAFALRENRWVSIAEVSSGKSCNCICPACHSALIAKKGKYNQHHFAHASEEICEGALETALHLFAKTVICKAKGHRDSFHFGLSWQSLTKKSMGKLYSCERGS